jgi:hypothetical protein
MKPSIHDTEIPLPVPADDMAYMHRIMKRSSISYTQPDRVAGIRSRCRLTTIVSALVRHDFHRLVAESLVRIPHTHDQIADLLATSISYASEKSMVKLLEHLASSAACGMSLDMLNPHRCQILQSEPSMMTRWITTEGIDRWNDPSQCISPSIPDWVYIAWIHDHDPVRDMQSIGLDPIHRMTDDGRCLGTVAITAGRPVLYDRWVDHGGDIRFRNPRTGSSIGHILASHACPDRLMTWCERGGDMQAVTRDGHTIADVARDPETMAVAIACGSCPIMRLQSPDAVMAIIAESASDSVGTMANHSRVTMVRAAYHLKHSGALDRPPDMMEAIQDPEGMDMAHRIIPTMTDPLELATWLTWMEERS